MESACRLLVNEFLLLLVDFLDLLDSTQIDERLILHIALQTGIEIRGRLLAVDPTHIKELLLMTGLLLLGLNWGQVVAWCPV